MTRFFVKPEQIKEGRVYIEGPDVLHITGALRLGAGDRITVLDGLGKSYGAVIEQPGRNKIVCRIESESKAEGAPPVKVVLVQGIPKGDKMDLIIQKGTELGVSRFVPLMCRRAVVKLENERSARKRERWQRIALESAKQCRRPDVPEVDEPAGLERVLAGMPLHAAGVIAWEEENAVSLRAVLEEPSPDGEIYVFIGPEGGFEPSEVEMARARGVRPVTLGNRVLRTETAGIAVLTMILFKWGDLGGKTDG
ncbi:MAG TPA: 16S rRNA (uracil(1498)-N(3))-methyltransferase [Bacillota bacterium]|nr:16S rRNA (uracil(1498)-N(3))-methyltransferase [Bacillota bacterium]